VKEGVGEEEGAAEKGEGRGGGRQKKTGMRQGARARVNGATLSTPASSAASV